MIDVYNAKDMFRIAEAFAIKQGPGVIPMDGRRIACYYLDRAQVEMLFEDNHYNLNRSAWRNALDRWQNYGSVVPKVALNKDFKGNWFVLFGNVDKDEHLALKVVAENEDCEYFPSKSGGVTA